PSPLRTAPATFLRHRSGHSVPVEVSLVPLDGDDGHVIAFLRDISARIQLEQEADRLRDELIANISHELRTPLTSVIGYLELLGELDEDELGPRARQLVDVIVRNAHRELRLVDDLLTVSFVEEDLARMRFEPVDLVPLARAAVEDHAVFMRAAGLDLGLEPGPDGDQPVLVRGDPDRLARVLDNLVVNACKFTPPGGRVRVRVASDGAHALLAVTDTGIGMNESERSRMFDRMYRAPGAVGRGANGAGLGLSIVKAIVDAHSGTIAVDSAPGRGTAVRVALPLSDQGFVPVGLVLGR
ncbi:HAMP domain-containing sensor histidine kinase, partial [Nocardioides sp.]|uniref:sensor histidine kinase n=1 Tax=Nocardioides sp. TaxID=35761 RepID=UPI0025F54EF2